MRKRILVLSLFFTCFFALSGCGSNVANKAPKKGEYPTPKITVYTDKKEADVKYEEYYYAVDERTGVVYIVYENQHQYGMTPAINADGTPMTKDQLMEEKEK